MPPPPSRRRKLLAVTLTLVFVVALVIGAGPGLYLVNPDRADPQTAWQVLGLPIVYVWAVFWFFVQAVVVVVAYVTLWEVPPRA